MMFFDMVETWAVPESAMIYSCREMARDGAKGNEGIALWLGQRDHKQARITHVVALRGPGVIKEPAFLRIEPWLLNDVTDLTVNLGAALVGQIHSHGKFYGTNLSETDRRYGFAVPYYLSIVAPDYAMRPYTKISDCGVHVFEKGIGYRRLTTSEISRRVNIVNANPVPLIVVGED